MCWQNSSSHVLIVNSNLLVTYSIRFHPPPPQERSNSAWHIISVPFPRCGKEVQICKQSSWEATAEESQNHRAPRSVWYQTHAPLHTAFAEFIHLPWVCKGRHTCTVDHWPMTLRILTGCGKIRYMCKPCIEHTWSCLLNVAWLALFVLFSVPSPLAAPPFLVVLFLLCNDGIKARPCAC